MMVNVLTWLKILFSPIKQLIIYFQNRKIHQNISRMYLHLHCPCVSGARHNF